MKIPLRWRISVKRNGEWLDNWVKNLIMVCVTAIWATYMLTYLVRGVLPEPALWGVPGGVWCLLNPPTFSIKKKVNDTETETK